MGVPPEPRELKAEDIAEHLKARDDFDLELFAYRSLKAQGWVTHHGGSYIDPLLGKRRQYDVRARNRFPLNCDVSMAVECKSLSREFPLVISRVPRSGQDAFHDIIRVQHRPDAGGLRTVSVVSADHNRLCLYGSSEMVGKSLTRIGWEQNGKKLISSDVELYDKWAQALASAAELVTLASKQTTPNSTAYTFIMPVLLVNDGSLWTVDYDEDGVPGEPATTDDAYYFADAEHQFRDHHNANTTYRMSHLHIYTRTGFTDMLKNYAGPSGTMWERTFGAAVRAG